MSNPYQELLGTVVQLRKENQRLTALCDGYRGEVERQAADLKTLDSQIQRWRLSSNRHLAKLLMTKGELEMLTASFEELWRENQRLQSALTRARAEGMEDLVCYMIDNCEREYITEEYLQNVLAAFIKARAAKGEQ